MQNARTLLIFYNMKKVTARFLFAADVIPQQANRPIKSAAVDDRRIFNTFMTVLGTFFLCIGSLGVVIPLLPTSPFLILTFYCYSKAGWKVKNKKTASSACAVIPQAECEKRRISHIPPLVQIY